MEHLPPFNLAKGQPRTTRKSAENWAHQLFGLFPSLAATTITFEFTDAVVQVLELYPEDVLAIACSPARGIASKYDFFPSLKLIKKCCDDAGFELSEQDRLIKLAARKPRQREYGDDDFQEDSRPSYTGPIKEVKPEDVLDHRRIEEYREFMQKEH